MGFSDVSKHSLPGICQPHFTAAFMLLILTATQFKRRLGLKSCLFSYLCLLILFVSIHYTEILLSIKPLWMPQQTCKHSVKWINWEVLGSKACLHRCSWINQLCPPTNGLHSLKWSEIFLLWHSEQVQWHAGYNSMWLETGHSQFSVFNEVLVMSTDSLEAWEQNN